MASRHEPDRVYQAPPGIARGEVLPPWPGPDWHPNLGDLPAACQIIHPELGHVTGYRAVDVVLRNGSDSRHQGMPWPAAGRFPPTRWSLLGHAFDIIWWRLSE